MGYCVYFTLVYNNSVDISMAIFEDIRFPSDRLDFETHLRYVSRLAKLSAGLSVSSAVIPLLSKDKLESLNTKQQLIALTKKSIEDEFKIVQFDKEYSTASVLWLPIKTYYLTYHLLCIIDSLLTGSSGSLTMKHQKCVDGFSKMLTDGSLVFSQPLFNKVFDRTILNFRTVSGEHLRTTVGNDIVFKLLMKKVANDKISNYKITVGIPNTRGKKNREKVEKFKSNLTISVFDYFYLMRLRLNYRNYDFIDNVPSSDTKAYFEEYYKTADNFYQCFNNFKNQLITDISVRV